MVQYRRNFLPGGTYFFTQALHNRKANYLTVHIDLLRIAMKKVQQKMPFSIIAVVILPEHLHIIWKLPTDDSNYVGRWRLIKSYFSQSLMKKNVPILKNSRGEYNLWQKRYWEHTIKDEEDLNAHIDYIHYNPVKHKLASVARKERSGLRGYSETRFSERELLMKRQFIDLYQGHGIFFIIYSL